MVLSFVGGRVSAKYQSQITAKGTADIAKWTFNVNEEDKQSRTITLAESCNKNTLINGKIAPGTTGSFDIVIDATGSEVGVEYKISFANESNKPTNFKFIYENVKYSSLQDLEKTLTGTIDANDENKKKILTINWVWEYEIGSNATQISKNDVIDTKDGKSNLDYTFDVIVTGTQATSQT